MHRVLLLAVLIGSAAQAGADDTHAPAPGSSFPEEASLETEVEHSFDRPIARERISYLLDYWSQRFGMRSEWRGDQAVLTGRVFGIDVRAVFVVSDRLVQARAFGASSFLASKAREYVHRKLRKYLHPNYEEP